jgi:hypothetical protein
VISGIVISPQHVTSGFAKGGAIVTEGTLTGINSTFYAMRRQPGGAIAIGRLRDFAPCHDIRNGRPRGRNFCGRCAELKKHPGGQ